MRRHLHGVDADLVDLLEPDRLVRVADAVALAAAAVAVLGHEIPHDLDALAGRRGALQGQAQNQGMDASALEASAARRVKLGVLLSEIVKQNQIQVDPDRVRQNIETIAASYENPDEVVQYYYGNQEMLTGVQTAVIEEQAVEWIMENSGVAVEDTPSSFDELVEAAKQSKG